jgi:hypothetical protein
MVVNSPVTSTSGRSRNTRNAHALSFPLLQESNTLVISPQ